MYEDPYFARGQLSSELNAGILLSLFHRQQLRLLEFGRLLLSKQSRMSMSTGRMLSIYETLGKAAADLQSRNLVDIAYPNFLINAAYIKCRDGAHVSLAHVTILGTSVDGSSQLI